MKMGKLYHLERYPRCNIRRENIEMQSAVFQSNQIITMKLMTFLRSLKIFIRYSVIRILKKAKCLKNPSIKLQSSNIRETPQSIK